MKLRHLRTLNDISGDELHAILHHADILKRDRNMPDAPRPLVGKSVAMIFSKSSTRTRVSFQVGIFELGGNALFFDRSQLQLGRGESVADTARTLSRYLHAVVIRTHDHEEFEAFAEAASIPVINALTDSYHPCQLLADLQTIREHAGTLHDVRCAFLGDGASNMGNSWVLAARKAGLHLTVGAPTGYQPAPEILDAATGPGTVTVTDDPTAAVRDAAFVYTDVWVSMGFEDQQSERLADLRPYQVNADLMKRAAPGAKFMHCLPAYRDKEVTAEVLDGPASVIWQQAENRLHAQKAALCHLIG